MLETENKHFNRSLAITSCLILWLWGGETAVFAAKLNLTQDDTGTAWLEQAGAAERNSEFARAETLYQRASISPGSEEAGTVGVARAEIQQGNSEMAISTLQRFVTDVNPFSLDAHLALADIYLESEQTEKADQELGVVSKLRPMYGPLQDRLAVVAFRKGNFHQAVASLIRVLERNPSNPKALELRARSYVKMEKFASALSDYKALKELDPANHQYDIYIAQIYIQLGQGDVAGTYLASILDSDDVQASEKIRAWVVAANLEQRKGNAAKAASFLKKAYEADPSDLALGIKLSDLYVTSHNLADASQVLDGIIVRSNGQKNALELGLRLSDMYVNSKNYSSAQQILTKILQSSPGNDVAAKRMLDLFQLVGRQDSQGVFLKNYTQAYPEQSWATLAYSKILSDIGNLSKAESVLATTLSPEGSPRSPEIALALVKIYWAQGRLEDAEKLLKKSLESFSSDDRLHFDFALCLEKREKLTQAQTEYQKVSRSDPGLFQKASVNLALILEREGKHSQALSVLSSFQPSQEIAESVAEKIQGLKIAINGNGHNVASGR